MIPIYTTGESYAVTLPGDRDPKTIWNVYPVTAREHSRSTALRQFFLDQKMRQSPAETAKTVLATADRVLDDTMLFIADHIRSVESPWPEGEYTTIEGRDEIMRVLECIGRAQCEQLLQIIGDGNMLRELSFRRDGPVMDVVGAREDPQADDGQAEPNGN